MFDDLPATLRRRAKSGDFNAQYSACFMRAADELVMRRRCSSEPEQEAVEQLGNVTILKRCLTNIAGIIHTSTMARELKAAVAEQLNIANHVKKPHKPRTILSVEIVPGQPYAVFLQRVEELFDQHTGGITHGEEGEEGEGDETPQPSGAGRDIDQHQLAEAPRLDAGGGEEERR